MGIAAIMILFKQNILENTKMILVLVCPTALEFEPGRVALLAQEPEVPGSIPGSTRYFRVSFR